MGGNGARGAGSGFWFGHKIGNDIHERPAPKPNNVGRVDERASCR